MDQIQAEVENEMTKIVRIVYTVISSTVKLTPIPWNHIPVSEGDHEKISKKEILLGRRKDKKDKKDKGYAALDGESSQEEDLDTK